MAVSGLRQRKRIGEGNENTKSSWGVASPIPLESFDLYQKVREPTDTISTSSGATVSLIAVIVCLILIGAEVYAYIVPSTKEHMVVDNVLEDRLRINFDITFPSLTCAEVSLDAMDVAGEQQNGLEHDIQKTRLDPTGEPVGDSFTQKIAQPDPSPLPPDYCGTCYGAESARNPDPDRDGKVCCNTCDDVRDAYKEKGWDVGAVTATAEQCIREHRDPASKSRPGEGCRIAGFLLVNKVQGNFHIAMGETHTRGAGHIHQFNPQQLHSFNVSHVINSLSFGQAYPGIKNPLDGATKMVTEGTGVFMYFVKVIPTIYNADGSPYVAPKRGSTAVAEVPKGVIKTNQYSVTSQYRPAVIHGQRMNVLPGVFFVYDISPFMVNVTRHTTTFPQLLTSLFAILGGVLSLAGLIDAGIFHVSKFVKKGAKEGLTSALASITPPAALAGGAKGFVSPLSGAVRPFAEGPPQSGSWSSAPAPTPSPYTPPMFSNAAPQQTEHSPYGQTPPGNYPGNSTAAPYSMFGGQVPGKSGKDS